ncbi:MAG: hypothetical protein COZ28_03430 [Candidatus Moranbacteria bacterium CG_4_10_14_3_um_filter_44_15]|nr:MAG: hypothetical protein COS72_03390 [Candidatus Moranbacteria bacterium CG06_land_8_20_14_3_00_43_56]PIV84417.1 MAG: hypothetical protein COW51_00450 [Candidatus Moranbacteria bacterium CG17_big_fil_post_rev_8_21_14_2_50_44_12]PIX90495.1 MAG: hypothetical protein COZ28_03430 [Candidatus Moranbacteria bacterium CG_4_10_14_3_um_filter_44_15]PJA86436.1 MAG: hypothetical protein CO142_00220 [Candidatus Moranbacteria bacterium CG_4_9_14_3_um_filter_44_28]
MEYCTNQPVAVYLKFYYTGNMPIVKCKICKKDFYAKPNWLRRGLGKYCSLSCSQEGRRKGRHVKCHICGKITYKTPKALKGSKSKKYFCGKSCQTIWRNSIIFVGKNHSNWKSGEFTYKNVLTKSSTPKVCMLCKENDKRILVAHHIDKNRRNNRLKNLIWLCFNCHFLVHQYRREEDRLKFNLKKARSGAAIVQLEGHRVVVPRNWVQFPMVAPLRGLNINKSRSSYDLYSLYSPKFAKQT